MNGIKIKCQRIVRQWPACSTILQILKRFGIVHVLDILFEHILHFILQFHKQSIPIMEKTICRLIYVIFFCIIGNKLRLIEWILKRQTRDQVKDLSISHIIAYEQQLQIHYTLLKWVILTQALHGQNAADVSCRENLLNCFAILQRFLFTMKGIGQWIGTTNKGKYHAVISWNERMKVALLKLYSK